MAAQRANVNLSYIMRGLMAVNREVTILFPRMFLEKKQGDAGALSCVEELGDPRSFHWEKTQEGRSNSRLARPSLPVTR